MAKVEDEARAAVLRMYEALDHLLLGRGTEPMREAWHHADFVTTVHPFGHWARGWAEVWATWEEIAAVFSMYRGHADRQDGIGAIHGLHVAVLGDAAYATGIYKSCLYLPEGETRLSVNCTNVLLQRDGAWKIVHHHPDQAPPDYQAALGRMVESAQP